MRAKALCAAGRLAWMEVDLGTARSHLEAGLALFRDHGDAEGAIEALSSLILVASWQGENERALALLGEGMEFVAALPPGASRLPSLHVLGWAASWMAAGEALEPSALLNGEAETLAREMGDRRALAWALDGLGQCRYFQGDFARARPHLRESLELFQELGDWLGYGHILWVQGSLARQQGQFEAARDFFVAVIEGQGTKNTPQGLPFALEGFAYMAIAATQPRRAAQLLAAAQVLRDEVRSVQQPLVRAEYEAQMAILKTQIEPDELEIAWQQGREMSRDEAIQLALQRGEATENRP